MGVTFDDPIGVLGHELDSSPAIAWLKDLDGRYVYVNRRYGEALKVAPERIVGYRDAQLTRHEIVDGAPFSAAVPRRASRSAASTRWAPSTAARR